MVNRPGVMAIVRCLLVHYMGRPRPSLFSHVVNKFDKRVSPTGCHWRGSRSFESPAQGPQNSH